MIGSNSSAPKRLSTIIKVNERRSADEIRTLVQQRVLERNGWRVYGETNSSPMPPLSVVAKFIGSQIWDGIRGGEKRHIPSQQRLDEQFPVLPLDWRTLQQNPNSNSNIQITWFGHATLLIQMSLPGDSTTTYNILTDPIFSQRCAPVQFAGPKRYRSTPCTLSELLMNIPIHTVLISHNHYDHLDYTTIQQIYQSSSHKPSFVVPLGLQHWFRTNIIASSSDDDDISIYELDWNESCLIGSTTTSSHPVLKVSSVPVRHWSNRTGDRDKTLWCGYALEVVPPLRNDDSSASTTNDDNVGGNNNTNNKVLFSGDTAWFDEMSELIGGPFRVAAIPIGAYEPREMMKFNHINVDEAIQMKDAVQAEYAVPIHWGTFRLTPEPVLQPRELLLEGMKDRDDRDSFVPWRIGETKQF